MAKQNFLGHSVSFIQRHRNLGRGRNREAHLVLHCLCRCRLTSLQAPAHNGGNEQSQLACATAAQSVAIRFVGSRERSVTAAICTSGSTLKVVSKDVSQSAPLF